jgi:CheY-like chemotaxis protein
MMGVKEVPMTKRIMAVNDDPDILEMLDLFLSEEGYEVHPYPTTDAAHTAIEKVKPDVIVLDWMFGGEPRGFDFLEHIKLNPATASIPIVVCSASVQAIREVSEELGAKGVAIVYKPYTLDELRTAITQSM